MLSSKMTAASQEADNGKARPDLLGPTPRPAPGSRLPPAVSCPACGTAQPADRKFCGGCGTSLWETCLACGAGQGGWERFCGSCGADLAALVDQQLQQFEAAHQRADALARLCRHPEAIALLEDLSSAAHPRLLDHASQARSRAESLREEYRRLQLQGGEHLEAARNHLAAGQFEQAIERLEHIPPRLRTGDAEELLQRAQASRDECAALVAQVRSALAERKTGNLLPVLERLLELKPDHEQAKSLAEQLQRRQQERQRQLAEQVGREARESLGRHDYAAAVRLLEQIDPAADPQVKELLQSARARAREVAWLTDHLQHFDVFDEQLLPLAERLVALQPHSRLARGLAERLARLHHQRQLLAPLARLQVARPDDPASGGLAVERLLGFQRIDARPLAENIAFLQNAGAFYVAAGLALHRLGLGRLDVNLAPRARPALARLAGCLTNRPPGAAWGIDLGRSALKAIKLGRAADGRAVAIDCDYLEYPHAGAASPSHPSPERAALEAFLARHPLDAPLAVSYPLAKTLSRFVELPRAVEKKLPELADCEARRQIPFPLDSVAWDYDCLALRGEEKCQLALFAARLHERDALVAPFAELGLKVDRLQPDAVALYNYLAFDHFPADGASPAPVALLDLGAGSSKLVIASAAAWFRDIPLAGNALTAALRHALGLPTAEAELAKRQPARMASVSQAWEALEPVLRDLLREVRRSLDYYSGQVEKAGRVERLFLAGGTASLVGLSRFLARPDRLTPNSARPKPQAAPAS